MTRVKDASAHITHYPYPAYASSKCGSNYDVCREHEFIGYMILTELFEQMNHGVSEYHHPKELGNGHKLRCEIIQYGHFQGYCYLSE